MLGTVMVLLLAVPAGEMNDQMKARCAREWPSDFAMQKYCYDQQLEAAMKVKGALETYGERKGSKEQAALGKCLVDWADGETYDFTMVDYCFKQQKEAIDALDE